MKNPVTVSHLFPAWIILLAGLCLNSMQAQGTNWNYVGTPGFSDGSASYTRVALGPSGQPFVV